MAQNIAESFHVPQRNRRNKLRVITLNQHSTNQQPILFPHTLSSPQALIMTSDSLSSSSSHLQSPNPQNLDFYQSFNGDQGSNNLSLSLSVHHGHLLNLDAERNYGVSVLEEFLRKNNGEVRSLVPLGPFTGYASILKDSRFLRPAQQILDDLRWLGVGFFSDSPLMGSLNDDGHGVGEGEIRYGDGVEHPRKISRLVLMLDEVYKRYKLYCQQIQSVVASFEGVSGLANAAPYLSFAFKAIAKHFSCLKNAILDQIRKTPRDYNSCKDNFRKPWLDKQGVHSEKNARNLAFLQYPVWRSQRGLPGRAVAVLKAWLFENFLHPYPTDSEKQMLALQTGLSRTQVSNWFINARVRLWKPMVEEIHNLEVLQQAQAPEKAASQGANMLSNNLACAGIHTSSVPTQKYSPSIQEKRTRNELAYAYQSAQAPKEAPSQGINTSSNDLNLTDIHPSPGPTKKYCPGIQTKRARSEREYVYKKREEEKHAYYNCNLQSDDPQVDVGDQITSSITLALGPHETQLPQPFPLHLSMPFNKCWSTEYEKQF